MKLSKKNITYSLFILLAVIMTPASAGSFSIGYGSGHNNHHYNYGHNYSSRHYNYGYGYRNHNSYSYKKHSYPYNQQRSYNNHNGYNTYNNHSTYTKPCHQVSKTVVDDYGQYQKVGGTMCYNSNGQGYVVSGSRYQIR